MARGINVVAIRDVRGMAAEPAAALARATGLSVFEARGRLVGQGPRVIASHPDLATAQSEAKALQAAGFRAILLSATELEGDRRESLSVRSFRLEPTSFVVQCRDGRGADVPFAAIRLVLRGMISSRTTHTDTQTQRKLSLTRALVSGGVMVTKKAKVTTTRVEEERELFLRVFAPGHPPLELPETEILYDGLGGAMQPTRNGNFTALLRELKRRALAATFDDQLASRAGQVLVLSEQLPPEEYLEVAVSVLARSHDAR